MKRIQTTLVVCGTAAALVMPAVPAGAASPNSTEGGKHCVVVVGTGESTCYSGFREAIAAATGGRITDAPEDPAVAVADESFEDQINALGAEAKPTSTPQALVTVSIAYDWNYYQTQAGSVTYQAAGRCVDNGAVDWQLHWVGSAWNDRISSFKGYNNCEVDHFENADFKGAHTGWWTQLGSMMDHTTLNNKTSSIKWG